MSLTATTHAVVLGATSLAVLEGIFVVSGISSDLLDKAFAFFFFGHLVLRTRWKSDPKVWRHWWSTESVLLSTVLWLQFVYRPRGNLLSWMQNVAKKRGLSYAIHHPRATVALVRKAGRWLRWITWCSPLVQAFLHLNDAVTRWRVLRRQKQQRLKRLAALKKMRRKLSPAESQHAAARMVQTAFRGRLARQHVSKQRKSAQLLARWAANKLIAAVKRRREELLERADARPLLLRPDGSAVLYWKSGVIFLVLLEMVSLVLYDQNDQKHSTSETFGDLGLRLLWPECIPHAVPDGGREYLVFGAPTTVAATLPSHCDEVGMLTNLLGFSPLWLLASFLSVLVELLSVGDTFVEFFIGEIDPSTGILQPKGYVARYLLPPHSLLFNIALNPALPTANTVLWRLVGDPNPMHAFRIFFLMQPLRHWAEEYLPPRVRRMMRRHPSLPAVGRAASASTATTEAMLVEPVAVSSTASKATARLCRQASMTRLSKESVTAVEATPATPDRMR